MALILKGKVTYRDPISRFLAIGPGESMLDLIQKKISIASDVKTIGLHRVFPLFTEKTGIKLDYWTWADPHGAVPGLRHYVTLPKEERPKIVVPYWMLSLTDFKKHAGTSPLLRGPKPDQDFYNKTMKDLSLTGEILVIREAVSTKLVSKTDKIHSNPELRFNAGKVYFTSAPYDGVSSQANWTNENKFTSTILPICYYLGATQVYNIGFDNKGKGIQRTSVAPFNAKIKQKYTWWTQTWKPFHKMDVYNLSPAKFSPNHTVMETVSFDVLGKPPITTK